LTGKHLLPPTVNEAEAGFGIGGERNRLFYSFISATGSGGGLLCKFFLHLAPMSSCSGDC